ncbi:MOSC domain-containing protein, partial [Ralstonia solanacearum]|uniref:MOSC domain-containing protein n=1 Tax=Ralstonia solanacearum TaxID=305 RepID=UPI00351982AE
MTLPDPIRIDALLTGQAVDYTRAGSRSAIDKQPMSGAVQIGPNGLAGDEQGDLRVHGGPDKAIHHYPFDHYPAWQADLGAHPRLVSRPVNSQARELREMRHPWRCPMPNAYTRTTISLT